MRQEPLALAGLLLVAGCPCGSNVCAPAQYCYVMPAGATAEPDTSGTPPPLREGTEHFCKDEAMVIPQGLDCDQRLRVVTCRSVPKP